MFVMVSQMMMNMETNLIAVFDIENETCVGTCQMKCLDSIDDVLMMMMRRMMIDDDDDYDDDDDEPIEVIDPAGSSHIFSQFEGGLVYFRFQVGKIKKIMTMMICL